MEEEKPKKRAYIKRIDLSAKNQRIKKLAAPKKRKPYDKAKKSALFSKYIINQTKDRVSFLRYFGFVMTYISVKYDISKKDLEILLYLYNEDYFDYTYFRGIIECFGDKRFGHFKRYQLDGYIINVDKSIRFPRAAPKVVDTSLYKMSIQAATVITHFYKELTRLIEIDTESEHVYLVPEEAQLIINGFQREIHSIRTNKKKPDKIVSVTKESIMLRRKRPTN